MATEIGALRARLSLDSAAFENGVKRSRLAMTGMQRTMSTTGAVIAKSAKIGAAAFAAASVAIVAGATKSMNSLVELGNQARIAGLAAQEFKVLTLAAKQFGVGQEKMADILKDVNDKFGDYAATGAGPLADFFENIAPKVGVTKEAFESLSSSDALALYIKSLEDANVSQQQMTFYMEALASDATALLPVFTNNAAALSEMTQRAAEIGLTLDASVITAAKKAKEEFGFMSEVVSTRLSAAFSQLLPHLTRLAEVSLPYIVSGIEKAASMMGYMGRVLSALGDLLESVFAGMAQTLGGFQASWGALVNYMRASWLSFVITIRNVWSEFLQMVASSLQYIPRMGEAFAQVSAAAIQAEAQTSALEVQLGRAESAAVSLGETARSSLDGAFDGALAKATALWAALRNIQSETSAGPDDGSRGGQEQNRVVVPTVTLPKIPSIGSGVGSAGGGGGAGAGGGYGRADGLLQQYLGLDQDPIVQVEEWHAKAMEALEAANLIERGKLGEHNAAKLEIEQTYSDKLAAIEAEAKQRRISETSGMFGALASIASTGGKKMAKAAAAAQAIEGTVNAYGAAIKALNTPGISLAGRFTAYASVLAAGLRGVSAIKSAGGGGSGGSGGGGGGSSVSSVASTSVDPTRDVAINVRGDGMFADYLREYGSELFEAVLTEGGNRNVNVVMT